MRLSPTPSSARIWSAQVGRASSEMASVMSVPSVLDVEVVGVEAVVVAELRVAQPELLGGVAVGALRARSG